MWPSSEFKGLAKPDTQGTNCMSNCKTQASVASFLPDYARSAHGNIADQNRTYGTARGANTAVAKVIVADVATKNVAAEVKSPKSIDVLPTLNKYACSACHGIDSKIVGPSFKEIAAKQGARADAMPYLTGKIKGGSSGIYGSIPMPPQSLGDAELTSVVKWIVFGAEK
jgi:S-disulfanyl-L-cysteine oxidoreductase SoxD